MASTPSLELEPAHGAESLDPFVHIEGAKSYFITPALHQRIELLRHLLEFGRQIVVLTGATGAGKSALLEQACAAEQKRCRLLRFIAFPTFNHATLLAKIADELRITTQPNDDPIESIRKHIKSANGRGEITILAIDDAHDLPADTLACLTALAHCVDEATELKIVLTANTTDSPLLDDLQSKSEQRSLIHVLEVPHLNPEQTAAMLVHRWTAAYGNEALALSPAEMGQIYQQSNGNPGRAIILARRVRILGENTRRPLRDPAQRYLTVGVILIAGFLLFAFFNAEKSTRSNVTQIQLDLPAASETVVIESAIEPRPVPNPLRQPEITNLAPAIPEIEHKANVTAQPLVKFTTNDADVVGEEPATEPTQLIGAPTTQTSGKPSSQPVKPMPNTLSLAEKPAPEVLASLAERKEEYPYTLAWLREQPGTSYVLQLFGVRDHAAAERFIDVQNIDKNSDILVTSYQGNPWYVVVYNYYPDRTAARRAISELPSNLSSNEPWARSIASLK
jgi:septal ring-binding cell division protein DamX/type II secretory pathway predicted ATPase ExeA